MSGRATRRPGSVRTNVSVINVVVPDTDHPVRLVRWPADAQLLSDARRAGIPRLILVDEGARPPVTADAFEDWIRLPALPEDIDSRRAILAHRALAIPRAPRPTLDGQGV